MADVRREFQLAQVAAGSEAAVLAEALDRAEPGDLVVYHTGETGSCPRSMKEAARILHDKGACLLTQRITGQERGGERIVDYLAVKVKGR